MESNAEDMEITTETSQRRRSDGSSNPAHPNPKRAHLSFTRTQSEAFGSLYHLCDDLEEWETAKVAGGRLPKTSHGYYLKIVTKIRKTSLAIEMGLRKE